MSRRGDSQQSEEEKNDSEVSTKIAFVPDGACGFHYQGGGCTKVCLLSGSSAYTTMCSDIADDKPFLGKRCNRHRNANSTGYASRAPTYVTVEALGLNGEKSYAGQPTADQVATLAQVGNDEEIADQVTSTDWHSAKLVRAVRKVFIFENTL